MSKDVEKDYFILISEKDEVLFSIRARDTLEQNPLIIYDGGDHAVFYRNPSEEILLDYVDPQVRENLKNVKKVFIEEIKRNKEEDFDIENENDFEIIRSYEADFRIMAKVPLAGEFKNLPTLEELLDK